MNMAANLPFPSAFEPIETASKVSPASCAQLMEQTIETDFESISSVSSRADNTSNLTRSRWELPSPIAKTEESKDRDLRHLIQQKLAGLDVSLNSSSSVTSWTPAPSMIPKDLLETIQCVIYKLKDYQDGFTLEMFHRQFKKAPLNLPRKVDICKELSRLEIVDLKKLPDSPSINMSPTPQFLKWFYKRRHRMVSLHPAIISEWQKVRIPDTCLTINDDFEVQEFGTKFKVGFFVEGYISEIITPDKFYIQLKSTEHLLNELMDDLQDFYCDKNASKYEITEVGTNLQGIPVAAIFFNQKSKVSEGWHRGIVRKIMGSHELSIFYCDYGSSATVFLPYVRFLHKRFGSPKAQAIRVKCGGIKPKKTTHSGKNWSHSANLRFSGLAHQTNSCHNDQGVCIQLMQDIRPLHVPKVILYDMVSNTLPNGIILNDVLLKEGFAKKDTKDIFHGLLPWEHPDLQCRQLKLPFKTEMSMMHYYPDRTHHRQSFDAPNVGSSSDHGNVEQIRSFISSAARKESFSKVIRWLPGCNTTVKVQDDKDFVPDQDLGIPTMYF